MTRNPDQRSTDDIAVQRLMAETEVTRQQALDLVTLLGTSNWPSLLREANLLKNKSEQPP